MWSNCECSMNASLMHSLHSHFRVCRTSVFSHPQPLLARFLDYTYIINSKKNTFFVFRHTLSHFEKSCFWMYLSFMLTNFEYHPAKFQIIYKPIMFETASYIIDNLGVVKKNVQNFCIVCHSKILRAAPYFAHLSNFKITTNTQISSKSQGSALAIFGTRTQCSALALVRASLENAHQLNQFHSLIENQNQIQSLKHH